MSEFAMPMVGNLALLKDHNSPLVKNAKFCRIMESSQAFVDALNSLNSKSSNNVTDEDVKTVLQYMYDEDNDLEAVVDNMFTLGVPCSPLPFITWSADPYFLIPNII